MAISHNAAHCYLHAFLQLHLVAWVSDQQPGKCKFGRARFKPAVGFTVFLGFSTKIKWIWRMGLVVVLLSSLLWRPGVQQDKFKWSKIRDIYVSQISLIMISKAKMATTTMTRIIIIIIIIIIRIRINMTTRLPATTTRTTTRTTTTTTTTTRTTTTTTSSSSTRETSLTKTITTMHPCPESPTLGAALGRRAVPCWVRGCRWVVEHLSSADFENSNKQVFYTKLF